MKQLYKLKARYECKIKPFLFFIFHLKFLDFLMRCDFNKCKLSCSGRASVANNDSCLHVISTSLNFTFNCDLSSAEKSQSLAVKLSNFINLLFSTMLDYSLGLLDTWQRASLKLSLLNKFLKCSKYFSLEDSVLAIFLIAVCLMNWLNSKWVKT